MPAWQEAQHLNLFSCMHARAGRCLNVPAVPQHCIQESADDSTQSGFLHACVCIQVFGSAFSYVSPTPTGSEPYLVAYSPEVRSRGVMTGVGPLSVSKLA